MESAANRGKLHYGVPVLGLPDAIRACLFDLDGVLTPTALVHAAAWKEMFDAFLAEYQGPDFTPFDKVADYDRYVDGRPRDDGTRTFLAARGITLPEGDPDDPPEAHTVEGMSKRKDAGEDAARLPGPVWALVPGRVAAAPAAATPGC